MNDTAADTTSPPRRRSGGAWWLVLLVLVLLGGWRGWAWWQERSAHAQALASSTSEQLDALQSRLDGLRRDQRAQAQRLQQADATNRVLRDELLGIGQRAALLEDSVSKLADPERHGAQALRLDEVELLLGQGQQRLQLAGDLDGARRMYALAAGLLGGVDDPAYLNLRQSLVQERAALDALGDDPRAIAAGQLEAFASALALPTDPVAASVPDARPWWQRAFARIVQVRPTDRTVAIDAGDRAAGFAALQLEIALARSALERRDVDAWRAALARMEHWLTRLWPQSPQLRRQHAQLQAMRDLPLTLALPTLGTTLQQLQAMRASP